ncbi:unnamed protein product [Meganyctiphanes norvegica]|uniref:Neural proliferation differentiation and control protein 1 n=1 Tax=Meganyctiphanes norvegica TaxID=48144 RepID=A0AAV2PXD8_MEGNR
MVGTSCCSYPTATWTMTTRSWCMGTFLFLGLVGLALAKPSSSYSGNVNDEEVVIDQLNRYLRSRGLQGDVPAVRHHPQPQDVNKEIQFAVGPRDPRYYMPAADGGSQLSGSPLMPLLPEDLALLDPVRLMEAYPQERYQSPRGYGDFLPQAQEAVYPQEYNDIPMGYQLPERPLESPRGMVDLQDLYGGGLSVSELSQVLGLPQQVEEKMPIVRNLDEEESKPVAVQNSEASKSAKKKEAKKATSQPEAVNYLQRSHAHAQNPQHIVHDLNGEQPGGQLSDVYFTAIVAGCTAVAVSAVVGAGMCWYRLNKSHRAAADAEYPAYGVTGPNKDLSPSSTDRKLAQSAHMYHYQHQKQQMIALEKSSGGGERHGSTSDVDSEEEGEEGDYTVYECPGLAPTGEMEVKNPLFHDDPTPATPSMRQHEIKDSDIEDNDEKIN